MNLKLIEDHASLLETAEYFKNHEWVGLDIETTELDPFNGEIRLLQLSDGDTTHVIDLKKVKYLTPLVLLLNDPAPRKVIHNAKFDAKWIKHHQDIEINGIFCTMLASQLLAAGNSDRKHSLAALSEHFLGVTVDKTEQVSDWGKEELEWAQIEYAAKDAAILLPLKDEIMKALIAEDLLRVAELENECVMPVLQMELNGFYLDRQAWQDQSDIVNVQLLAAAKELQLTFGKYYPQPSLTGDCNINLDSHKQVTDALKFAGVPATSSTEEWRLQPLVADHPVVGRLLDHRGLSKAQSSYGPGWFNYINPYTGRIHAEFDQTRASTGRFGCSNPNLQQIPQESAYRSCFTSERGNMLVIADYSQIELRILAYKSGDPKFIAAFNSGADFHQATASEVFGVPLDQVTSDQRSFAKRLNFGIVYGIGAPKFAALTGVSRSEAEEFMSKYFSTFQTLAMYIRDTGRQSIVDRRCRTESGRMLKLRFDENDRGSIGAAKRNGVNMPIQGTSADILKRALRLVHDEFRGTSVKLVNIVHDEIILEAVLHLADKAGRLLHKNMVRAGEEFITGVPVEVDVRIAYEWKK